MLRMLAGFLMGKGAEDLQEDIELTKKMKDKEE